ncbi:MAG TPA: ACP S-malonyltransferase [Actinomycetota bacterium]|nr:ACP S-malonyltransferase [Actinomycetota bacterium]
MHAAIVFPGQGSQFVGMADVWITDDAAREVLDEATDAIGRDIVAGCRDEAALTTTEFVQPALLACDVAAFRVLDALGVTFVGAAGHSLGEFAALVAAEVVDLADALRIVAVRGRAMQAAGDARPGTMTALLGVGGQDAAVLCDEAREGDVLLVANENSPQQVVISGSVAAIERAEALAAERKIRAVRLNVAGAFHSPLMTPAVEPLAAAIDEVPFAPPRFPIASNVTGALVTDPTELRALAERHVVSPVRWQACAVALRAVGADTFVEAGPGDVLTKLAKRAVPGARAVAIGSPEAAASLAAERA